ncbi:hypothetical protein [Muricoccus pecuniae]|uniref:Uncharacterized protein n=1 Tax=Muricoccus pecuniae TaxID=693023 RepID=A0A840Y6L7_9PROT|nr:hypothetical protein [Roseomonas pecuniae]MBB5695510.1 hypothetical protein [Roseomonas pecuniae]
MKKSGVYVRQPKFQVADKSQPPVLFPLLDPLFNSSIGELIIHWSLMEQNLNLLVWALLQANHTSEGGWRYRPFEKRYELLRQEWEKFAEGYSVLPTFLNEVNAKIRSCKILRDSIAHKEMILGLMEDGDHSVQFYNETRAKQKSKRYYLKDFTAAVEAAREAAGWLYWLTDPTSAWPLPSEDTQRLRSLPSVDHLRSPT